MYCPTGGQRFWFTRAGKGGFWLNRLAQAFAGASVPGSLNGTGAI